jgi:hypothetical protein
VSDTVGIDSTALVDRARRTSDWLEARQHVGWDLFDVRDTWLGRACRGLQARGIRGPGWFFRQLEERRPLALRRILGVEPRAYPKGIGLSCQAYAVLQRINPLGPWAQRCSRWLAWLRANPSPGYRAAWGYPHFWRSEIPIPAQTPSGVVSTACGWAFVEAYRTWGRGEDHATAVLVAEILVSNLRRLPADVGFCFSYTPIDAMYCHNASLLTAAYLADVCAIEPRPEWEELARRACLYTLSHQEPDGSFRYFGPPHRGWRQSMIDHFHTGFVLRCLNKLRHLLPERVPAALSACYAHYVTNFFGPHHTPRLSIGRTYPVDVHSVAEAALVAADFADQDDDALARGLDALDTGERMLAMGDGSYQPACGAQPAREPIAYVRWGAAWMLLAHARLAAALRSRSGLE